MKVPENKVPGNFRQYFPRNALGVGAEQQGLEGGEIAQ